MPHRLPAIGPAQRGDLPGVIRGIGRALGADRCWLYARDPAARTGIALARWLRAPGVADVPATLHVWTAEAADLAATDPLFGRALAGTPADVVDDVAHADVDPAMEAALGHHAFVHLNLHHDGRLWGVLQPGMTAGPRVWSPAERDALLGLRPALAPLVAAAVAERPPSVLLVA